MSVNWIAKKPIDYELVNKLLKKCEETNHYTNFGKNVEILEKFIREKFEINESKSIICVSNATLAIWCLCSAIEMKVGKKLQWVTQSFTFPSSAQGILKDTIILDIDEEGGLDLKEVEKIKDKIDGIIVTNIFGNVVDIDKYVKWAEDNNKYLVFDNAATAYTFYKGQNSCNYGNGSIISFHHTKPFGFGEGGAIIIDKKYEEEVIRLINFGIINKDQSLWNRLGGNYKMSEISGIYILQYLENNFDKIVEHHIKLYNKYKDRYKMYPNFGDKNRTVLSCFCLLDEKYDKKYVKKCNNKKIEVKKYYYPLKNTKNAVIFYNKVLCFPLNMEVKKINI